MKLAIALSLIVLSVSIATAEPPKGFRVVKTITRTIPADLQSPTDTDSMDAIAWLIDEIRKAGAECVVVLPSNSPISGRFCEPDLIEALEEY